MNQELIKQAILNRLAGQAAVGAGLGGLTGLAAADPGERMRGLLLGAGLGAGAFVGGRKLATHYAKKGRKGIGGMWRNYKQGLPAEGRTKYTSQFLRNLTPENKATLASMYGLPLAGLGTAALI